MNRKLLLGIIAFSIAAIITLLIVVNQSQGTGDQAPISNKEKPSKPSPLDTKNQIRPEVKPANEPAEPIAQNAGSQIDTTKEAALNTIHEASIQYSPEQIPVIIPFLESPDIEIRKAALDGLIVLGESAAASHIRIAAKRLEDPREAAVYMDTADYLELPSYKFEKKDQ